MSHKFQVYLKLILPLNRGPVQVCLTAGSAKSRFILRFISLFSGFFIIFAYHPETNVVTIRIPPFTFGYLGIRSQPLISSRMITGC